RISSDAVIRAVLGKRKRPPSPPARAPSAVKTRGGRALLGGDLDDQLVPALPAPGIEDLAAPLGRHAGAGPWLVAARAIARAIRRLHQNPYWERLRVVAACVPDRAGNMPLRPGDVNGRTAAGDVSGEPARRRRDGRARLTFPQPVSRLPDVAVPLACQSF